MKFSEFMEVFKFWKKVQEDPDFDDLQTMKTATLATEKSFSEADLEAAKTEAAKTAKAEAEAAVRAEFSEAETKRKKSAAKDKITSLIAAGVEAGTIAPAWKNAGLAEFMEALDGDTAIEFGEAKDKKTGLDWFISFLETLPKLVDFDEIATRDKDVKAGNAGEKLTALIAAKRKENKDLSYGAAFAEVQAEHPDLALEYQQEMAS